MEIYDVASLAEMEQLAIKFAQSLQCGDIVSLVGNLGSGKTTFTQFVGKTLGITRAIKSPTYTIVKEYPLEKDGKLIHIDAYRLEDDSDDTIDVDHYLTDNNIVMIEWAEYIQESLPKHYKEVTFEMGNDVESRKVTIKDNIK